MNAINPVTRTEFLESLTAISLADVLKHFAREFSDSTTPAVIALPDLSALTLPPDLPESPREVAEPQADVSTAAPPEIADNVVAFIRPAVVADATGAEPVYADEYDGMGNRLDGDPADAPEVAEPDMSSETEAGDAPVIDAEPTAETAPIVTTRELRMMCDRQALAKAVGSAIKAVEKRNTIPILSNVLIEADGAGNIIVEGTDLDMSIRVTVPTSECTHGFALTVPAHHLHDLLKKSGPGEVSIHVEEATTTRGEVTTVEVYGPARIRCGPTRTALQTLPTADYPHLVADEFTVAFDVTAAELCNAFGAVEFAISTEETRYYLNGTYLHAFTRLGEPILRMVATDGHRLATFDLAGLNLPANAVPREAGAIVPRKMVAVARSLFGGKPPKAKKGEPAPVPPSVKVDLSGTKVRFTSGATVVTSKLIDGTYPDYCRVIPAGNDKVMRADAEALAAAVARVSTVSSERGRAVRFALSDDRLVLSVSNPDTGTITEELAVEYRADPLEIGFNTSYLRDILAGLEGDVTLRLADPGSPTLIEPSADKRASYVLMPMRV